MKTKKTRMNAHIRALLMKLVKERVGLPEQLFKLNVELENLENQIREHIEVPLNDFNVLQRYKHGHDAASWAIHKTDGTGSLYLTDETGHRQYCQLHLQNTIRCKQDNYAEVNNDFLYICTMEYMTCVDKYREDLRTLHESYWQFIKSFTTYEDLCEQWAEAKEIASQVYINPIVPVNAPYMNVVTANLKARGVK